MDIVIRTIIFILFISGVIFLILNQRKNIKEWLLYAVIEAEKSLGSKMGKVKLRQVYDEFILTFPLISKIISFKSFSYLVDLSLNEMEKLLSSNYKLKEYIEGEKL